MTSILFLVTIIQMYMFTYLSKDTTVDMFARLYSCELLTNLNYLQKIETEVDITALALNQEILLMLSCSDKS